MALSLQNGIRGRFNLLTRLVRKGSMSPAEASALWFANRSKPMADRDERLWKQTSRRDAQGRGPGRGKSQRSKMGRMAGLYAAVGKARSNPYTQKQRANFDRLASRGGGVRWTSATRPRSNKPTGTSRSATVRALVREVRKLAGKGKGGRSLYRRGFAKKVLSSAAARKSFAYPISKRKGGKGKSKAKAVSRKVSSAASKAHRKLERRARKAGVVKGAGRFSMAQLTALTNPRGRGGRFMRRNPGSALLPMGDLAFTNPSMGVTSYLTGYALPIAVAGAAGGGVHALLGYSGATEKLSQGLEMIPGVGSMLAEKVPFTVQGLLVGSALALVAAKVGGGAGKYLALTGGSAIVFGAAFDAFNALSDMAGGDDEADGAIDSVLDEADADASAAEQPVGDLAFTNISALGDLAFTNVSALGDGFAFETAPLTADMGDFAQCSLADAQHCGADFTAREGQAILNGPASFTQTFGNPSHRAGPRAEGVSHHAGREGYRWGWLVKMIGWPRTRSIVALPPARRLVAIQKLRLAAVQAYNQLHIQGQVHPTLQRIRQHQQASQPAAGSAPAAPAAPSGAEGAAGAEVGGLNFMGEPALFVGA